MSFMFISNYETIVSSNLYKFELLKKLIYPTIQGVDKILRKVESYNFKRFQLFWMLNDANYSQ